MSQGRRRTRTRRAVGRPPLRPGRICGSPGRRSRPVVGGRAGEVSPARGEGLGSPGRLDRAGVADAAGFLGPLRVLFFRAAAMARWPGAFPTGAGAVEQEKGRAGGSVNGIVGSAMASMLLTTERRRGVNNVRCARGGGGGASVKRQRGGRRRAGLHDVPEQAWMTSATGCRELPSRLQRPSREAGAVFFEAPPKRPQKQKNGLFLGALRRGQGEASASGAGGGLRLGAKSAPFGSDPATTAALVTEAGQRPAVSAGADCDTVLQVLR